ncbi:MAG: N-acetylneuraminate synthase family protein [Fimbriimonadaceae bacterium]
MIIVMQVGATPAQVEGVVGYLRDQGVEPIVLPGQDNVAIGIPATLDAAARISFEALISTLPGVSKVTQTSHPYKLASREWHRENRVVEIKGVRIGEGFVVMAGPCSVESGPQMRAAAQAVKESGATVLRGGAFKPRTSPYAFQGLAAEGLQILRDVGDEYGLVTVSEVMSPDMVDLVAAHVDILQIGARSMQNFPLLVEAGKSGKPVFLKRGPSATIDEFLLAAEYVLSQNNPDVILCERGVMPLDRTYVRNTLTCLPCPCCRNIPTCRSLSIHRTAPA